MFGDVEVRSAQEKHSNTGRKHSLSHLRIPILVLGNLAILALAPYPFSHFGISLAHAASPDFAVSASTEPLTIPQGSSLVSWVSVTSLNNFTGTVSLTSSSPTGITATINPASVTPPKNGSTRSDLNITIAGTVPPGSYNIGITGTSGSTHSTNLVVQVVAPDFALSASTASIGITQAKSGNVVLTLISNGFSGRVTLTAQVSPPGPTATQTPPTINLASGTVQNSTMTVRTSATTSPGAYTITVTANATGPSGPITHSVAMTVSVNAPSATDTLFSPVVLGIIAIAVVMVVLTVAVVRRRPPKI